MTIRLSVIAEAARKATPGPWILYRGRASAPPHLMTNGGIYVMDGSNNRAASVRRDDDAHHIANCDPATVLAMVQAVEALVEMTARYTALVNCGDCGNWDPETEAEVIAARQALASFDLSGMG